MHGIILMGDAYKRRLEALGIWGHPLGTRNRAEWLVARLAPMRPVRQTISCKGRVIEYIVQKKHKIIFINLHWIFFFPTLSIYACDNLITDLLNLGWLFKYFTNEKMTQKPSAPLGIRTQEHEAVTLVDFPIRLVRLEHVFWSVWLDSRAAARSKVWTNTTRSISTGGISITRLYPILERASVRDRVEELVLTVPPPEPEEHVGVPSSLHPAICTL